MQDARTLLRVIVVDDHPLMRDGICQALAGSAQIDVVADTGDGREAMRLIAQFRPDIAILDIRLPGRTGLDVARWCRQQGFRMAVIMLTAYDHAAYGAASRAIGVDAFLVKSIDSAELLAIVLSACGGDVAHRIDAGRGATHDALLSKREQEVVQQIALGRSDREIGQTLGISTHTVRRHCEKIYDKLQAHTRTGVIHRAVELGLLDPEDGRLK